MTEKKIKEIKIKEITKSKYKLIVFGTIIVGLIVDCSFYVYGIYNGFNSFVSGMMTSFSTLIGYGIGLAVSRTYKIKGVDD